LKKIESPESADSRLGRKLILGFFVVDKKV